MQNLFCKASKKHDLNASKFCVNKLAYFFLKCICIKLKCYAIYCCHLTLNHLQKCHDRDNPIAVSVLDAEWDCKRGIGRLPETPLDLPGRECARLPRDPPVSSEQQPQGPVPVCVLYIL